MSIPRGRISSRKFLFLAITFLVTVFGYSFFASTPVFAADAKWNGTAIVYNNQTYAGPNSATAADGLNLPVDSKYYLYVEPAAPNVVTRKAHVIYFAPGADPPKESQASVADYDQVSGIFSNKTNERSITLTPQAQAPPSNPNSLSSCNLDGIGWLVCPASKWIAEGMDYLYGTVESFLKVAPLSTTNTSGNSHGIYEMWKVMLNIANVGFIIGFLILIYGQITGGAVSNYTIKKLLPRIIVAAVLVNISYWVCALAVDISNVLGVSVQHLFMSMFDQLGAANSQGSDIDFSSINWSTVTAAALSGTAVVGGLTFLSGGVGVSAGALALTIVVALIPALFAVFVAVAILAARQALITIFIIISPLAFVAYLLPNTEEWFTRWRKLFLSMLIMFPAFAVVFGGAQLAGKVIIQTAETMPIVILGLVVQVVPLFITPFLIKLSSGLLSTIAGLTNDRSKGVFDWAKNDLTARRDASRSRAQAKGLNRLDNGTWANSGSRFKRGVRKSVSGAYLSTGDKRRDARKSMYDNAIGGYSESHAGRGRKGFQAYELGKAGGLAKDAAEHSNQLRYEQKMSRLEENRTPSKREDRRYSQYRHLEHESHESHARADALEKGREERGKAAMMSQIALAEDGTYDAKFREYMAETQKQTRKATSATAVIQHVGDKLFDEGVYTDQAIRTLRIAEGAAEDQMKTAKAAQEKLFTEMRVDGSAVLGDGDSVQLRNLADAMQNESIKQKIIADAVQNAEIKDKDKYTKTVRANKTLEEVIGGGISQEDINWADITQTVRQVGGGVANIDADGNVSREGSQRMLARARKERSARLEENVGNAQATLSEYDINDLIKLEQKGILRDSDEPATDEERFAATFEIMQKKGNQLAAMKSYNYYTEKFGMVRDDDGNYYMPERDENGEVRKLNGEIQYKKGPDGQPQVLTLDEAEEMTDAQQMMLAAYRGGPHRLEVFSGTQQGLAQAGLNVENTRGSLRIEINEGKMEPDTIATTKVDEIRDWARTIRDPEFRDTLDATNRINMVNNIRTAMSDPILSTKIQPREFETLSVIANYLEDIDNQFSDIQKETRYRVQEDPSTHRKVQASLTDESAEEKIASRLLATENKTDRFRDDEGGFGPGGRYEKKLDENGNPIPRSS